MKMNKTGSLSGLVLLGTILAASPAPAQTPPAGDCHEHAQPAAAADSNPATAPKISIPDVALRDQDGKPVHFYSDLVKGRVVAINFIFTTCTTICPPLGATFAGIQKLAAGRAGRDFTLISVSVDPVTDTPERLKSWSAKFGARPGWTLVTGPKKDVDRLLSALGAGTARPQDHTPLVLIGNEATGSWTRASGLAAPEKLVGVIEGMISGSTAATVPAAPAAEAVRGTP